jgi:hypothetical protein
VGGGTKINRTVGLFSLVNLRRSIFLVRGWVRVGASGGGFFGFWWISQRWEEVPKKTRGGGTKKNLEARLPTAPLGVEIHF